MLYDEVQVIREIKEERKLYNDLIYITSTNEDKMIKVVYENENPCPVAYQLGFNRHCKHAKVNTEELELDISCDNIGCEECFFERKELK